jgi:hypothetical protein
VGLFCYIRFNSSVHVHVVAPQQSWGLVRGRPTWHCIGLVLLLSMAELGTESAAELRSGPTTELGDCLTAELGAALWQSHRMFLF